MIRLMTLLIIVWLWLSSASAAIEVAGERFPEQRLLLDTELSLVGSGLLNWGLVFKVYAGAFYLPKQQVSTRWAEDIPKILELAYFREISAEDFRGSSKALLLKTLTENQYRQLSPRLETLYQMFRDVRPGDRYTLAYHPTVGTQLLLNGEGLGRISGHDFAVAYFGLWLGPEPINKGFRDRLLALD